MVESSKRSDGHGSDPQAMPRSPRFQPTPLSSMAHPRPDFPSKPPPAGRLVADPLTLGVAFALLLTVVQRGVGFVRGMLFCRLMPDEQLGQWSVIWSSLMLLAPLAALGLPGSFCRYVEHYLQRGQLAPYLRRVAAVACATTLALAGAMLIWPGSFSTILFRQSHHTGLIRAMAGTFVLVAAFNSTQSLMESLRQVRIVSLMRFINGMVFAVAGLGLLLLWRDGTLAVLMGFAISCLAGLLPAAWFYWRHRWLFDQPGEPLPHRSMWEKILPFAAWIWVANFLNNSCDSIDRFLLLHLSPGDSAQAQSHLGQYHSSLLIPQLLVGVAVIISGTLLPYLSAAWERNDRAEARRLLRWTLKTSALGFLTADLIILLAAPWLFDVLLQGKYSDGLAILPMTMVYSFWFCMITTAQSGLWCNERMKWVVLALLVGLLANIAFNSLCIPWLGIHGVALATAASNAICLATMLCLLKREGWTVDRGTCLACGLPVLMLLPPLAAVAGWTLVVYRAVCSDWVFDASERQLLRERAIAFTSRFGRCDSVTA